MEDRRLLSSSNLESVYEVRNEDGTVSHEIERHDTATTHSYDDYLSSFVRPAREPILVPVLINRPRSLAMVITVPVLIIIVIILLMVILIFR